MKGLYQGRPILCLLLSATTLKSAALPFELLSVRHPSQDPPAGGSGNSYGPILSSDGRYVLFESAANNLALDTSSSSTVPAHLNVFLRDRTNATTTLVSVSLTGRGGNGNSFPAGVSTNGRFALFESTASDLVPGDTNNVSDIFVRDLVGGTTALVNVSSNGGFANGVSRSAAMSPDGRFVAFVSAANNLVAGDTNGIPDIFLRDLQAGTTTLISVGAQTTNSVLSLSSSESPEVSADGRYVSFYSTATNLVAGGSLAGEIYIRDTFAGSTIWASGNARALANAVLGISNVFSFNHAISSDGKFVAFQTSTNPATVASGRGLILRYSVDTGLTDTVHTNAAVSYASGAEDIHNLDISADGRFIVYVANNTTNNLGTATSIYLWDSQSGSNTLVSATLSNTVPSNSTFDWPSVDATGRFVAFLGNGTNLVTNSLFGEYHVYLRDVQAGITSLLDEDTNGIGSSVTPSTVPRMSADGSLVAFEAPDASLVSNDRNHDFDVFVRDLNTNAVELISARHASLPSTTANGPSGLSSFSPSTDGRYVAFSSDADNLVPNDTNGVRDIFVRDLFAGTTLLASVDNGSNPADAPSSEPAISGNGRYVAFTSSADNLTLNDVNRAQDVFVRDLQSGATILVSVNTTGTAPGNNDSYSPFISNDGRYVLFRSKASNLATGGFSGAENLFLRDMQLNVTYALTTSGVLAAAMTPDGRYVAFNSGVNVYLWDSQVAGSILTSSSGAIDSISISSDGLRIVWVATNSLRALDRTLNSNWLAATQVVGTPRAGLRFSPGGHFLVYKGTAGYTNTQIFIYDFEARTSKLVSKSFDGSTAGNGDSDSSDISADGRFVVYRSLATNLVAAPDNLALPDLFLYDRSLDTTTRLTSDRSTGSPADNRSLTPAFSGDGHLLVFQTWASDIAPLDFNHGSDVLSLSFLYTTISQAPSPLHGPTLTWPARTGETYQVQTNGSLNGGGWQNASGTITITGNQAQFTDPLPAISQKFYRIVAF